MADNLMPGEWEAAGRGTFWGIPDVSLEGSYSQEARLQQENRDLEEAIAIGRMDPYQANTYVKSKNIRSGIQGIAKLFGAESRDPALRRAETMDMIFKSLSPDELKNPALALSTIADRLEEQGYPRDAVEARMKSIETAQQLLIKENQVKDSNSKKELASLERVAKSASAIYNMYDEAPTELQEQLYDQQVNLVEKEFGTDAANQLRSIKPSERKLILRKMVDEADKESSRSREDITNAKIASALELKELSIENDRTKAVESRAAKVLLKEMDINFKVSKEHLDSQMESIKEYDVQIEGLNKKLAGYLDTFKTSALTPAERTAAIISTQKSIATLEAGRKKLSDAHVMSRSKFGSGYAYNAQGTTTSTASAGGSSPTGTKTEYETNFATVQAALNNPRYNAVALLAEFKAKYPNQPQPDGSGAATVTPTPGASPVANPAAPAAVVPPKPQTEAERREQIFLERLNDRTPLEVMQDVGSSIAGGFQQGEKYFQEKRDAFNKDIDIAASVAKEKLKDKTFVSKLSERQLKRLNEIANDSGAKHKAYQDSDTPYDALPLAGLSSIITKSASSILNKGSKILAAKAVKDATRTPSDIESNMAGLQDRLKRVEELERARKLKQIGDSDKEVLRQIKEEIKLMDQANESALKESLKNAETATQRKVAMEQRKRLADIRKEIKRVFSIAGSTPVPYKKPEFN